MTEQAAELLKRALALTAAERAAPDDDDPGAVSLVPWPEVRDRLGQR